MTTYHRDRPVSPAHKDRHGHAAPMAFDVPAQPLDRALALFARQAGLQLALPPALAAGRNSTRLGGTREPAEALEELLRGSGLRGRIEGTTLIVDQARPTATEETTMPAVRVTATADKGRSGSAADGYRVIDSAVAGFSARPIKDTPYSVTLLPQDLLLNHGVQDLGKLDQFDASVSNSASNWYPSADVRGFWLGTDTNYRLNGQTFYNIYTVSLENKQRVELLKGLSGLQAGFASPSGILNYVTKRPADVTDLHLYADQYGDIKTHVDHGRLVSDTFGYRINAVLENQRSFVDKVNGPRGFFSAALDWRLSPATLLTFDVEHENRRKTFVPTLTLDTDGDIPTMPDPSSFYGQEWAQYKVRSTLVNTRLEHVIDNDWSVSAGVTRQFMTRNNNWLGIGTLAPDGTATLDFLADHEGTDLGATSLQLMTKGRFQTGSLRHEIAFGYDFVRTTYEGGDNRWYGGFGTTNIHAPVTLAEPTSGGAGPFLYEEDSRRHGLFVHDVIGLGTQWDVHLGGRQSKVDFDYGGSVYKRNVFTPSAALVFKPRPYLSAYVSYAEGLETGGTAPTGTTNADQTLPPLISKQWEAGLKGEIGALGWGISAFRLSKPSEFTNSTNTYVQDGERVHKGIELSMSGKLSRELTLYGSALTMDAKVLETGDPAYNDKRPSGVPKRRVAMTAEYAPRLLAGWVFASNWTHTGNRAVNAENTAFASGYDILALGVRHERMIGGQDVTFRLNVDNVLNKRYWSKVGDNQLVVGSPRAVSASMSVGF